MQWTGTTRGALLVVPNRPDRCLSNKVAISSLHSKTRRMIIRDMKSIENHELIRCDRVFFFFFFFAVLASEASDVVLPRGKHIKRPNKD